MTADLPREIDDLTRGLSELGITLPPSAIERFRVYLELLERFHGQLHLISHRDYGRISIRHFLPSLLAADYASGRRRGADLGSGAGFPSLPIKIIRPDLDLTLIESVGKKARFLKTLCKTLDLPGCEVINDRAETYPGPAFDLLFLKAAGPIRDWVPTIDRLLTATGAAVFFKTVLRAGSEIAVARTRLERAGFRWSIRELLTPLERRPLALVELKKNNHLTGSGGSL